MRGASLSLCAGLLFSAHAVYAEAPKPAGGAEEKPLSVHASVSASAPLAIPGKKPTELLSQAVTLENSKAAILVLATVELVYTSVPTSKTVEISIMRDEAVLGTYPVQVGTAPRAVSEIPITLHALDVPGSGPHAYSVVAKSSDRGVEATARRLTVLEIP